MSSLQELIENSFLPASISSEIKFAYFFNIYPLGTELSRNSFGFQRKEMS